MSNLINIRYIGSKPEMTGRVANRKDLVWPGNGAVLGVTPEVAGIRSTAKQAPTLFVNPVIITATIGGAEATGRLDVIAEHVYLG
jgi:hypothetical protein